MIKAKFTTALLLITSFLSIAQTTFTSTQNGSWTNPATWGNVAGGAGVGYPGTNDEIVLNDSVWYDINKDTTTYGPVTFNTGCALNMQGAIARSNHTVFNTPYSLDLDGKLYIGSHTIFLMDGNLTVNPTGAINFVDRSSVFRMTDIHGQSYIRGNIYIQNGVFSLEASGNNQSIIDVGTTFTAGPKSALYFEGSNGSFTIDGTLTFENSAEFVANLQANLQATINGTVTFEYGSSFFQGDGINNLNLNGDYPDWQVELADNGGAWRHICSPFGSGVTLNDLSGTDFNPNVTSGQENMFRWNASVASAGDPATGWEAVTSLSDAFTAGDDPVIIYTGDANYPFSNSGVVNFVNLNITYASTYNYTLYNSVDTNGTTGTTEGDQGWNLIGNPYPSWLNLDSVLIGEMSGNYQGAHMWNAQTGQYSAYVVSGESIERTHDLTGASLDSVSNNYIRPFQAFWVKVDASTAPTSTPIEIKQEYRALDPFSDPPSYFKTGFIPRLRLNCFAASDSAWDQVLITLNPNASKQRLGNEDAFDRPSGNDRPNMALIHEDGERLCIDSRPLDSAIVIPMSFTQGKNLETYYIGMVQNQYDPGMSAYLEDLKTNSIHNLQQGDYSFSHDISYPQPRFKIHLAPYIVSQSELNLNQAKFQVWIAGNLLRVQLDKAFSNQDVSISIFDMSGRQVFTKSEYVNEQSLSIPLDLSSGTYIVKVIHPQLGIRSLKVIL